MDLSSPIPGARFVDPVVLAKIGNLELVAKYVFGVEGLNWIAVVHGWVYFIYLLFTANLAVKVRWPIAKTIGVLLAGTIPLVGIIVEHFQTKDIKQKFGV